MRIQFCVFLCDRYVHAHNLEFFEGINIQSNSANYGF